MDSISIEQLQNSERYYDDESLHGNYQYVSLKTIINTMEAESLEDDSYLKNTKRSRLILHAKEAIREVTRSAANDILQVQLTVPPNLVWPLPEDYVNWVRVSAVVKEGQSFRLIPLDINNDINIAAGFLQDHDWQPLFDHEGRLLLADSDNAYDTPYVKLPVPTCADKPFLDTSKFSKNGEFTIDERRGKILFSSDLAEKDVVIHYVSDGLQANLLEEEITVHKYLKRAIEEWVYFACIERKRNVPRGEKHGALLRYKTSLHQAKLARADFDMMKIAKALRANSMML